VAQFFACDFVFSRGRENEFESFAKLLSRVHIVPCLYSWYCSASRAVGVRSGCLDCRRLRIYPFASLAAASFSCSILVRWIPSDHPVGRTSVCLIVAVVELGQSHTSAPLTAPAVLGLAFGLPRKAQPRTLAWRSRFHSSTAKQQHPRQIIPDPPRPRVHGVRDFEDSRSPSLFQTAPQAYLRVDSQKTS
jgi:hypothetical protein